MRMWLQNEGELYFYLHTLIIELKLDERIDKFESLNFIMNSTIAASPPIDAFTEKSLLTILVNANMLLCYNHWVHLKERHPGVVFDSLKS